MVGITCSIIDHAELHHTLTAAYSMNRRNIAFYAPMKSPEAAQPSGDRTIGRLLMAALARAGFDVRLVSHLRTWSAVPDSARLVAFRDAAEREADALVAAYVNCDSAWVPDVWFTYHAYYKAPDLLGPRVAAALKIPYVITEASYASRRAHDEWANWLSAARSGICMADAIFSFTTRDQQGLTEICPVERLHDLAPFLDLDALGTSVMGDRVATKHRDTTIRLVTVAMMRPGAKLASYQLLASSLIALQHRDWHLDIVGDGEARCAVERAFAALPAERIHWHGRLDSSGIGRVFAAGDVFVWPGLEEAFGMVYLEAQAAGLPVAAVRTAGVPEVVRHGETGCLANDAMPRTLAECIENLIVDPVQRRRFATAARAAIENRHSLAIASIELSRVLRPLVMPK